MRSLIIAICFSLSLTTEAMAQEFKDMKFDTSQIPDPNFSIERQIRTCFCSP